VLFVIFYLVNLLLCESTFFVETCFSIFRAFVELAARICRICVFFVYLFRAVNAEMRSVNQPESFWPRIWNDRVFSRSLDIDIGLYYYCYGKCDFLFLVGDQLCLLNFYIYSHIKYTNVVNYRIRNGVRVGICFFFICNIISAF